MRKNGVLPCRHTSLSDSLQGSEVAMQPICVHMQRINVCMQRAMIADLHIMEQPMSLSETPQVTRCPHR